MEKNTTTENAALKPPANEVLSTSKGKAKATATPKKKATPTKAKAKVEEKAPTAPKGPKVRVTGKNGSLRIHGFGTIKEFASALREKDSRPWENPTATAFVNGLVVMGGAKESGFSAPNPEGKKGRTSKIYAFDAKIGK